MKLLSNLNKVNPIQIWESFGCPNGECQADSSARLPTRHISPLTLLACPLSTSHYLTHCVYFIYSRLLPVTEHQLREGKDFVCCCRWSVLSTQSTTLHTVMVTEYSLCERTAVGYADLG